MNTSRRWGRNLESEWARRLPWLVGCDLETEWKQASDEGRRLTPALERQFSRLREEAAAFIAQGGDLGVPVSPEWLKKAHGILDAVQSAPLRAGYLYEEPSGLDAIRAARPRARRVHVPAWEGDRRSLERHIHGAWLGRIAGCMLGKPVEGWRRAAIEAIARAAGDWPLSGYFRMPSPAARRRLEVQGGNVFDAARHKGVLLDTMCGAVEDDDTNYTVIGFDLVRRRGPDFTSLDVAEYWLGNIPILRTCTAERVAYAHLADGVPPPRSAAFRNPYREWIGAQIRADYFGYAQPGQPARAAEWAWRDAAISHVKNGIYGEMWVAAMLAAALVLHDWPAVIRAGLDQIPARCRLREAVEEMLRLHASNASYEEAIAVIHGRWNEADPHHWCHTISNAQIVAVGLLYGEDDFGKTITRAVMPGFDTDCNGATCGSLWGARHGVEAIPSAWSAPLNDRLRTGVAGFHEVSISELAAQMTATAIEGGLPLRPRRRGKRRL